MCVIVFIFFFKQKTAYEMRISDWSSDVCSSDRALRLARQGAAHVAGSERPALHGLATAGAAGAAVSNPPVTAALHRPSAQLAGRSRPARARLRRPEWYKAAIIYRSEEHTSELQSLMRSSYAVFCLKKKNKKIKINNT